MVEISISVQDAVLRTGLVSGSKASGMCVTAVMANTP